MISTKHAAPTLDSSAIIGAMAHTVKINLLLCICCCMLVACKAGASPSPGTVKPAPVAKKVARPAPPPGAVAPPKKKLGKVCAALKETRYLRKWTSASADSSLSGRGRVALARKNKLAEVQKLMSDAGLKWPPRQVMLRAFKLEKVMEVWASDKKKGPLKRLANYGICSLSGGAGPKLREGDGQVPEGFYFLDFYHSSSTFFLAMRVNYPNRRDRRLRRTGSAIMIHGNCVSIGCLAMSDERIQELWLLTSAARRHNKVAVHIFPSCGMTRAIKGAAKHPKLQTFWTNIKQGMDLFEKDRTLRRWRVGPGGEYLFP